MPQGRIKGLKASKTVGVQFTSRKNKPEKRKVKNEQIHKLKKIIAKAGYKRIENEMKGIVFEDNKIHLKRKKDNPHENKEDPNKMPPPSKK